MGKRVKISRLFFQAEGGSEGSQVALTRTIISEERLLLGSIESSLAWAGIARADIEGAGIIIGVDSAIDKVKESYFKDVVEDGALGASPLFFPYTSPNVLAARSTIHFGIKGPDITIASGQLSFLKAVSYAYCLVSSGIVDIAVAAGVTEGLSAAMIIGLERSDLSITSVVESRFDLDLSPDIRPEVSIKMKDTFSIFQEALGSGAQLPVEASDISGNTIRIGLAFDNGAALKEEAFA